MKYKTRKRILEVESFRNENFACQNFSSGKDCKIIFDQVPIVIFIIKL